MQVETFEAIERELAEHAPEEQAKALELIEELGLDGQQELLTERDDDDGERCPYRRMTAEEQRVYGAICEKTTEIEAYASGPIPLRVLQVAAHARPLRNGTSPVSSYPCRKQASAC